MTYLMINESCNMRCIHCCFSCTSRGRFIDMKTVKKAVDIANNYGEDIIIGGGEPTLHPSIVEIAIRCAAFSDDIAPCLITNGTCERKKWDILTRISNLDIRVSNDIFHDTSMIKPWVKQWAENNNRWWKQVPWNNTYRIEYTGRAKRNRDQIEQTVINSGIASRVDFYKSDSKYIIVNPDGYIKVEGLSTKQCPPLPLTDKNYGVLLDRIKEEE